MTELWVFGEGHIGRSLTPTDNRSEGQKHSHKDTMSRAHRGYTYNQQGISIYPGEKHSLAHTGRAVSIGGTNHTTHISLLHYTSRSSGGAAACLAFRCRWCL